ncbi:hypothetical protein CDL15_Pgr019130 [Punica granatum]|uniref:Disease resistance protein At4g27190-like leucine-rich repeats domain-containing protein n=1 Tax=Punica granatum TaxID=22663 RepID=A0A218XLF2_PUNGR|nr:hypothetical protein CDL15_Pgr019130 [Punica granatum]
MNSLTTIWDSQVAADSLSELIEITVEGCDKLVTLFPPGTACSFQNLEVLEIRRCSALEVVYEIEENAGSDLPGLVAVTKLKKLSLTDLANLQHIWRTDPRGILRFQNLSSVSVMGCSSLGYLFHASVAKALIQLVKLKVKDSSLEVIVAKDKGVPPASTLEFVFPRATKLELSDLPQLKSFYPGKYISRWPSLRKLMISKSNKVAIFAFDSKKSKAITRSGSQAEQPLFLVDKGTFSNGETLHMQHNDNMKQIIWSGRNHPKLTCFSSGVHFHFANLTTLKVENCRSLKNILTPNMVSELPWLATLEIKDCAMLEAVIVGEKKARRRNIRLGKLRYVTLESLPKLVSFCPHGCLFECPSLKGMTLKNCPEMRTFTSPHLKEKALNAMGENSKESYSSSVEGCDSLVTIFPPCMGCALWKLEWLKLKSCSSLEVIYDMQGLTQDNMEYSDHVIVGTQLKNLELSGLPKLENIWKIADPRRVLSFHNLERVKVEKCASLRYLFLPSVARVLYNLIDLVIEDNIGLEGIVAAAVDEEAETAAGTLEFVFPRATRLRLCGLPGLKSFSQRRHISKWPSLENLQIDRCESIQNLFSEIDLFQDALSNGVGSPNSQQTGLFLVDKVSFPQLEEFTVSGMKNLGTLWRSRITGDCFSKLKEIKIEGCDALVTIFPPNTVRALWKLEKLKLEACSSLEVIYDMQGLTEGSFEYSDHVLVGTQLKKLHLSGLPKLKHIWNTADSGRILSFNNLDSVEVEKCESLKNLFPPSAAKVLYNLSELVIEDNRGLEEIVAAAVDEEVETAAGTLEFVFPQVTRLRLCGLPELKSFCQRGHISKWPRLEKLEIKSCDCIQNLFCHIDFFQDAPGNGNGVVSPPQQILFFVDKVSFPRLEELTISGMKNLGTIWRTRITGDCFNKLREIIVEGCDALVTLFPPNMALELWKLEKMKLESCSSLEVIYDMQRLTKGSIEFSDHVIVGTKLKELHLSDLQKLEHVWSIADSGRILSFHDLDSVVVEKCGSLKYVFPPSVAKVLYNLSTLVIEDNRRLEDIVAATVDKEVEIAADTLEFVFPRVTHLRFCGLPGLKSFYQRRHISKWPSLEKLQINRCDSIHNLFSEINLFQDAPSNGVGSPNSQQTGLFLVDKVSFPRLEELTISGMKNLGTIWPNQITGDCFSKLKGITIEGCDALVTIFPPNMVRALWKLEKLELESCSSLEVIYDMQGLIEDSMEYSDQVVAGSKLKELRLNGLRKLEHIWSIADPGRILSFHNLDSVEVEECESLMYLFPSSVAKVLYNLSKLVIEDNRGLEEIVAAAVDEAVETVARTLEFVFPRATHLRLCGLPGLKSFCQRRHISKWPLLRTLQINRCDSIQNLFCEIDLFRDAPGNNNDVGSPSQRTLFLVDKYLDQLEESFQNIGSNSLH